MRSGRVEAKVKRKKREVLDFIYEEGEVNRHSPVARSRLSGLVSNCDKWFGIYMPNGPLFMYKGKEGRE